MNPTTAKTRKLSNFIYVLLKNAKSQLFAWLKYN